MSTYQSFFASEVKKLMEEKAQNIAATIVSGNCTNYEAYKYQVGLLHGIQRAADCFDEAETIIAEEEAKRGVKI